MTNIIRLVAISINDGLKIAASYYAILWALDRGGTRQRFHLTRLDLYSS